MLSIIIQDTMCLIIIASCVYDLIVTRKKSKQMKYIFKALKVKYPEDFKNDDGFVK